MTSTVYTVGSKNNFVLTSVLQYLTWNFALFFQVQNCHQRQHGDGTIEDVCDGQLFRTHPLFSTDSTALQVMLYYDELEITNPLGSKTGKHKLGIIKYIPILNSTLYNYLILYNPGGFLIYYYCRIFSNIVMFNRCGLPHPW